MRTEGIEVARIARSLPTAAIAATVFFSACGDPQQRGADAPRAVAESATSLSASIEPDEPVYAVTYYLRGGHTLAEVDNMIEESMAACMASLGLAYVPQVSHDPDPEPLTRRALVEWRRRHGYGFHRQMEDADLAAAINANRQVRAELTPEEFFAYERALEGDGDGSELGGCRKAATDEVNSKFPKAQLSDAQRQALPSFMTDPQVLAAYENWRACLLARGFDASNLVPESVTVLLAPGGAPAQPSLEAELALAVADTECQTIHVWPVYNAVAEAALRALGIDS